MTTEWLPVHVAAGLAAPLAGAMRYQISVCALPLVAEVPAASVRATPPKVTPTPVGAPCPNVRPTTRTRFEAPPGSKERIVAVVVLAALVFVAVCNETEADAAPTIVSDRRAEGRATRRAASHPLEGVGRTRRSLERSRTRTESMTGAWCNHDAVLRLAIYF